MRNSATKFRRRALGLTGLAAGLMVWGSGQAQLGLPSLPPLPPLPLPLPGGGGTPSPTSTGEASGVTAVVAGNVTSLASTGTFSGEPLGTGLGATDILGLGSAEALHAVTMGWPDQMVSEASLANLTMTLVGTGISADFILSRAQAVAGSGVTGASSIEGLSIAGSPISPSGAPNQVIWLPGLTVTLNEQVQSAGGIVVNALHVRSLDGLTDVVIGSARAGI